MNIYWIDLFSGAGGTTTGIHLAGSTVIACVNHDKHAIAAHKANHPNTKHFTEDIRDFAVVQELRKMVDEIRAKDPLAVICIWASLECTNFSKAKGGLPRDADSRTLAEHMFMYIDELTPDYFWVENVREFMAWGPLDERGRPVSRSAGRDYVKWINDVKSRGYRGDAKILNSANFGAYQARERLFIQFAAKDYPISWPEQTHTKDPRDGGLFPMKKWKPVREVLDLDDEGKSIFDRKKPLSDNTLKRIYAGLVKFIANGEKGFTKQYNSGNDSSRVKSFDEPINTITTENSHAVVNTQFLAKYFSGKPEGKVKSIDEPSGTVTTFGGQTLVSTEFLKTYYTGGNGLHSLEGPSPTLTAKDRVAKVGIKFLLDYQYKSNAHSLEWPSPTLLTKDKFAKVNVVFIDQQYGKSEPIGIDVPLNTITINPKFALVNPQFIMNQYSGGGQVTDIEGPAGTITGVPKANLVSCAPFMVNRNSSTCPPVAIESPAPTVTQRTHILINPSWSGHATSTEGPSCTVIARQDKSPLYLMVAEHGPIAWMVFEDDSEIMVKIKEFMVLYGITDIKMRMLKVIELKRIQGFPPEYVLCGNQTEQKKQIGNAVEVKQARAIALNHTKSLQEYFKNRAA